MFISSLALDKILLILHMIWSLLWLMTMEMISMVQSGLMLNTIHQVAADGVEILIGTVISSLNYPMIYKTMVNLLVFTPVSLNGKLFLVILTTALISQIFLSGTLTTTMMQALMIGKIIILINILQFVSFRYNGYSFGGWSDPSMK